MNDETLRTLFTQAVRAIDLTPEEKISLRQRVAREIDSREKRPIGG